MINAKDELLKHIQEVGKTPTFISIKCINYHSPVTAKGQLSTVLPHLNFEYDNGYGTQELFGYVWFTDGSWSERDEYDGSERWTHKSRPNYDEELS